MSAVTSPVSQLLRHRPVAAGLYQYTCQRCRFAALSSSQNSQVSISNTLQPQHTDIKAAAPNRTPFSIAHLRQRLAKTRQTAQHVKPPQHAQPHTTIDMSHATLSQHTSAQVNTPHAVSQIPGKRVRTVASANDDIDSKPSGYMRQLMLQLHPDTIVSQSADGSVQVHTPATDAATNSKHAQASLHVDTVRQCNQQSLATLNAMLDYNKQFDRQAYQNTDRYIIKPPLRQSLSFYCRYHPDTSAYRLITVAYKPPRFPNSRKAGMPTVIVQDSIEQTIYALLKAAHVDISEAVITAWQQRWHKHAVQYGLRHATGDRDSVRGVSLAHAGVTGQDASDKAFLAAYREHRSSVVAPERTRRDIRNEYDVEQWAASRPRYTLCSMMAEAGLIEFDKRLDATQRTDAVKTLQLTVAQHYTELQCALWTGIGVCFVPPQYGDSASEPDASSDSESMLINSILKQTSVEYNAEWDFVSRPGWWLIPYNFTYEQLRKFVKLFLHANKTELDPALDVHQHTYIQA